MPRWKLDASDVAELMQRGHAHRYASGDTLFNEGDPSNHAVLILAGHVKVTAVGADGRELMLGIRGPQSVVGEFAAVDNRPRSAKVTAIEPVDAVVVTAEALDDFLLRHPRAMRSLLVAVIGSLREADLQRVEMGASTVAVRVIRRLLDLAERHGDPTDQGIQISLRITQEELAGWVSASRVTTSRVLRKLRDAGVITTAKRRIVVRDLERLRRLEAGGHPIV